MSIREASGRHATFLLGENRCERCADGADGGQCAPRRHRADTCRAPLVSAVAASSAYTMVLGKRSDYGDSKYAGLDIGFSPDIEQAVQASTAGHITGP